MSRRLQAFKSLNMGKVVAEKQRSEAIIHSLTDGIVVDDQLHIVAILLLKKWSALILR